MVLVILAQNSKGGGLSSQFGGSSTSQIIGVKKTGDFLERFTWGLAIALLVLTLSTDFFIEETTNLENGGPVSPNIERATDRVGVSPQELGLDDLSTEGATDTEDAGTTDEGSAEDGGTEEAEEN